MSIPRFDSKVFLHAELARTAGEAERVAKTVPLTNSIRFQRARKLVRDALIAARITARIEELVEQLLNGAGSLRIGPRTDTRKSR